MGRLINGEWVIRESIKHKEDSGEFVREESTYRDWIRDEPDARFQPEADRYHLYISRACPWAHRTTIMRRLKGLEECISMSIVEPVRVEDGWEFSEDHPDHLYGAEYLREIYQKADPNATTRVSVPVLWDKKEETIVNNESRDILRILDTVFDQFARHPVSFVPAEMQELVDQTIDEVYGPINNGVYRAGFATMQRAYEKAMDSLFNGLDRWEDVLENQRYLCGDRLTEADICLFTTLYRFDSVYHVHFKCNLRRITDYPNLWNYLRELYQIPEFNNTCNMDHIKRHYYMSHTWLNPNQIVPAGPDLDFDKPHNRGRLSGEPLFASAEFD